MFGRIHSSGKRLQLWISSRSSEVGKLLWNNESVGDCFYLLDVFLLISGTEIQSERTPKRTNGRIIRIFVNCVFIFQTMVTVLQLIHALDGNSQDVFQTVLSVTKLAGVIAISLKWLLLTSQTRRICSVLNFITSNQVTSGDEAYDELEHEEFNRSACTLMRVIFGLTLSNAVLVVVPSAAMEQALGLPPPLTNYGKLVSNILYLFASQLLFIGTVPKFLSNMACIGMLIMGMRSKLKILAHRYRRILNQSVTSSEKNFTGLERDVKEVLIQQMEYRRHFKTLRTLVEKAFFIAHFYALYSIGSCFYLSHKTGLNFLSLTLVSLSVAYILKYYLWCYLVDSLQDVTDSIGDSIYEHCAQMPYSPRLHGQYVRMKTSLIIIWMHTRIGYSISCMGMIDITTQSFVSFLNVVYSVMMFLINVV